MDWLDVLGFVGDLFVWGDLCSWKGLLVLILLIAVVAIWVAYGPVAGVASLVVSVPIFILVDRRLLS